MKVKKGGKWFNGVLLATKENLTMVHVLFADYSSGIKDLKRRWVSVADVDFGIMEDDSSTQNVSLAVDGNSVGTVSNYLLDPFTLLTTNEIADVTYQDVMRDQSLFASLQPYRNANEVVFVADMPLVAKEVLKYASQRANSYLGGRALIRVCCFICGNISGCMDTFARHFQSRHEDFSFDCVTKPPNVVLVFVDEESVEVEIMEFCPFEKKYKSPTYVSFYEKLLRSKAKFDPLWMTQGVLNSIIKMKRLEDAKSNCVEVCPEKFFGTVFGCQSESYHSNLLHFLKQIIIEEALDNVRFPWRVCWRENCISSFKIYIILGTEHHFVERFGNCLYVGFSYVYGFTRVKRQNYDEIMQCMLNRGAICCCAAAFDMENTIGDLYASRRFGELLEDCIYAWFAVAAGNLGYRLLNKTNHWLGCSCCNCVGGFLFG